MSVAENWNRRQTMKTNGAEMRVAVWLEWKSTFRRDLSGMRDDVGQRAEKVMVLLVEFEVNLVKSRTCEGKVYIVGSCGK